MCSTVHTVITLCIGFVFRAGERNATPSAGVLELREDMVIMKGQLNELKQMMRASFDLQLDIQRAIRQEVSAALAAFISQPQLPPNPHSATASGSDKAVCQIPTLGICTVNVPNRG